MGMAAKNQAKSNRDTSGGRALNVIWNLQIPCNQKTILLYLGAHMDFTSDFSDWRWTSHAQIAEGVGLAQSTVRLAINNLCDEGYLVKAARANKYKGQLANAYRFTDKLFQDGKSKPRLSAVAEEVDPVPAAENPGAELAGDPLPADSDEILPGAPSHNPLKPPTPTRVRAKERGGGDCDWERLDISAFRDIGAMSITPLGLRRSLKGIRTVDEVQRAIKPFMDEVGRERYGEVKEIRSIVALFISAMKDGQYHDLHIKKLENRYNKND